MHRTDALTLTIQRKGNKPRVFTITEVEGREVERWLKHSKRESAGIPARLVLPELSDDTLRPAISLRGKRPIGNKMAMRLAKVFGCDYRVFL